MLLADPISQRAYARHRGVNHSAVQKAIATGRISKGVVEVKGRKKIDLAIADAEWERNTNGSLKRGDGEPESAAAEEVSRGPSFNQSHAIREAYLAKIAKLQFEEKAGTLIRAEEVRLQNFAIGRTAKDALFAIPSRIADQLAAESDPHEIRQALKGEIDTVVQELIRRLGAMTQ